MFEEHTKVIFNISNDTRCQSLNDPVCHHIEDYSFEIIDLNVTKLFINVTTNIHERVLGGGNCTIYLNTSSPNDLNVTFIPLNSIMEWKEVKISGGTLSFIMGITASLDESPYSQSVAKNDVPRFLKEHEHENGIGDWNLSIDFNNHGYGFPGDALINWTITVTESFYDATIIDER